MMTLVSRMGLPGPLLVVLSVLSALSPGYAVDQASAGESTAAGAVDAQVPPDAITIDQARAIAEQHAGVALAGVEPQVRGGQRPVYLRTAEFTVEVDGRMRVYAVWLTTGKFRGWRLKSTEGLASDGEPGITLDEAMEKARAEALRHLGAGSEGMTWTVLAGRDWSADLSPSRTLVGEGPPVGDPPRSGLSPLCEVSFNVPSGEVTGYFQLVPDPEPLIDPKITAHDATRIAREDVGNTDAEVLRGPELRQAKGELTWALRIAWVNPWGKDSKKLYIIDAVTGDIVTTAVPK